MPNPKPIAKNVIWIVVDSVRNYHTDADDRGRIAVMDELAQNAIEFKTAVTSAPSTVMSTSAMMTGVPAIFHSRTYDDFDFNKSSFKSLPLILKDQDYNIYSIIFFPEGRNFLGPMMGNLCRQCWPKNANTNEFWDNDTINQTLENVVSTGISEPFFLFVNYNCRYDPQTSDKVKHGIETLSKAGLLNDAVLILNSDHGYPDPSRQITFIERRKYGHDLVMTDDNILVPLFFSYPGCTQKTIEHPVSLLDVMPTVLDLIGKPELCNFSDYPAHGHSLMNMISGKNQDYCPTVRTDNRYIFQPRRTVAFRNSTEKYIYSFDDNIEEFYDLIDDPGELNNLTGNSDYQARLDDFRKRLYTEEEEIYLFHRDFLAKHLSSMIQGGDRVIAILGEPNVIFIQMIAEILRDSGIQKLILFYRKKISEGMLEILENTGLKFDIFTPQSKTICTIDLTLAILINHNPKTHYSLRKQAKKLVSKRTIYTNYNLKKLKTPLFWLFPAVRDFLRIIIPRFKENPKGILIEFKVVFRKFLTS